MASNSSHIICPHISPDELSTYVIRQCGQQEISSNLSDLHCPTALSGDYQHYMTVMSFQMVIIYGIGTAMLAMQCNTLVLTLRTW